MESEQAEQAAREAAQRAKAGAASMPSSPSPAGDMTNKDMPKSDGAAKDMAAGANPAGQQIAGAYADVVYSSALDLAPAQAYYASVKDHVAKAGRNPEHCLIMPGLVPIVGRTRGSRRWASSLFMPR